MFTAIYVQKLSSCRFRICAAVKTVLHDKVMRRKSESDWDAIHVFTWSLPLSKWKDRFYSGADPKTTAWQLLDVERCKYKSLIVICFYSVLDPKLTALLIKRLLDLDRCKHRCLVEICFYSDTDPNLLLDQERLYVCPICLIWGKFDRHSWSKSNFESISL